MKTTVAFLGPAGTFTEAALQQFITAGAAGLGVAGSGAAGAGVVGSGAEVEGLPVGSPSEAFAAVRAGRADFACVAMENSVDGAVTATYDAFVEGGEGADDRLQIYAETDLEVAFAIMTRRGHSLASARTLSTHPVAYQQIRTWVGEHLPDVKFVPASSNAAAAESVARGEADVAAAPARAAELLDLEVHAESVADVAGAVTRFVLVGRAGTPTPRTGADRTSVVFTLPNEPGTLVGALQEFAYRGVDMSRIESRPTRTGLGTYRFYVDLVGHIDDAPVAEALRALWLRSVELVFLGSWPAAGAHGKGSRDLHRLELADAWVASMRGHS